MQTALDECFAIKAQNPFCHRLAAKAQWVRAEWLAVQGGPTRGVLEAALAQAKLATATPELSPDSWQVLAETHLRLAQSERTQAAEKDAQALAGLMALDKLFAINPNHAEGHITLGALKLFQARSSQDPATRKRLTDEAVAAAERALTEDPLLRLPVQALLQSARELAQAPTNAPTTRAGR